jgi:thiamine-phosphate pyrophosphorylase
MTRTACQLYLLSPPRIDDLPGFLDALQNALAAGPVAAFQLRLKNIADDEVLRIAKAVRPVLSQFDVALILNDRADLAFAAKADGVHLGQQDGDVASTRKLLGADTQIGVTCHDSRHLAMEAGEAGADYVAFGAFYPTTTKNPPSMAMPDILSWWSKISEIPCVAIGGITIDNAAPLIEAGADFLAVSSGVWAHPRGPAAAVSEFNHLLMPA